MFKYFIYKIGQFLVNHIPIELSYKIAVFISDLQYFFSFRDRKSVKNNLKKILETDKDLAAPAREVFRNFGKYLVEFFCMKELVNENFIKTKVKTQNIERVQEALQLGKGGIILTAHIGNWELGAVLVSMLAHPLMAVALPHKERPVNDLFNHQREAKGIKVVPTNIGVRKCIDNLKNNGLIALVADRDFSMSGEVLDFLGDKSLIPKGAASFAEKTGAPIVPTFLVRNNDGTFTLSMGELIFPVSREGQTDIKDAILTTMKKYTSVIEEKIREYPTQWLMFREFGVK